MTNEEYRKMRGTDKPADLSRAAEIWRELYGDRPKAMIPDALFHDGGYLGRAFDEAGLGEGR